MIAQGDWFSSIDQRVVQEGVLVKAMVLNLWVATQSWVA